MWNKTLLSIATAGLLIGCNSDSSSSSNQPASTTANQKEVSIQFAARVGNEDISCESMPTAIAGTTNTNPEFTDVRMYVSEIALINEKGAEVTLDLTQDGKWQYKNVALLDFETGSGSCANGNNALNHVVKGTAPKGSYTGVKFTLGVPAELNHYGIDGEDAVSPLDVLGMNWSWQNGHKHLRMDIKGWNIHLGTTGCESVNVVNETVDCSNSRPNRPVYQFDNINFDNTNNTTSRIVFDYQKLTANSDLSTNAPQTPPGCMSSSTDSDCQNIFTNLGLDLTTGQCLGGDCTNSQTWVSVE